MLTWIDHISTLEVSLDGIGRKCLQTWIDSELIPPRLRSLDRISGQEFKSMLKILQINSAEHSTFGYLLRYPSLVCALLIFDPLSVKTGRIKQRDDLFYRCTQAYKLAKIIDRQSNTQNDYIVRSSGDSHYFTFKIYNLDVCKVFNSKPLIRLSKDPQDATKDLLSSSRMINKMARFKVKHSAILPDHSTLGFFRDPTQGRMICLAIDNRDTYTQVNLLLDQGSIFKGIIEARQINVRNGEKKIKDLGYVKSDKNGKILYDLRINPLDHGYDLYNITALFSRLGMTTDLTGKERSIRNVSIDSILYTSQLWDSLGFDSEINKDKKLIRVRTKQNKGDGQNKDKAITENRRIKVYGLTLDPSRIDTWENKDYK